MINRWFCVVALVLSSASAWAQDKTLTFDNATPAQAVHLLNSTSVSIDTSGNLVAKCVLGTNLGCADIGTGTVGGGTLPSVSIAASGFSTTPDGSGQYSANTTFTLTPTVSNADVCWRRTSGPTSAVWAGAITSGFNNPVALIPLSAANTTYGFTLECYNTSGGVQSLAFNVTTNSGVTTGGTSCDATTNTAEAAGFTRTTLTQTWQSFGGGPFDTFDMTSSSVRVNHMAGLAYLSASRGTYTSIQFTTPSLPWGNGSGGSFIFDPSQITNSPSASSPSKFNYVTISRCPGDFRFNIQNPVDPTDSQACKSVRRLASGTIQPVGTIYYNEIGVSGDGITNNQCGLAPGQTYYLNYINADATDGIQASEHTCPNNITTCGVEFKAQTNN